MKFLVEITNEEVLEQTPLASAQVGRLYSDIARDAIHEAIDSGTGFIDFEVTIIEPGNESQAEMRATIALEMKAALRRGDGRKYGRLSGLLYPASEGGAA